MATVGTKQQAAGSLGPGTFELFEAQLLTKLHPPKMELSLVLSSASCGDET